MINWPFILFLIACIAATLASAYVVGMM